MISFTCGILKKKNKLMDTENRLWLPEVVSGGYRLPVMK